MQKLMKYGIAAKEFLYNKNPLPCTIFNSDLDNHELSLYNKFPLLFLEWAYDGNLLKSKVLFAQMLSASDFRASSEV